MNEAADSVPQVNECAVGFDGLHRSLKDSAGLHGINAFSALLSAAVAGNLFAGQNETLFLGITGDDADIDILVDPCRGIFDIAVGQLGGGNKGPDPFYISHDACLDCLDDLNSDDFLVFHHLFQLVPCQDIYSRLAGQGDAAAAVVHLQHLCFDRVTLVHILREAEGGIIAHIRGADKALCIVLQINRDTITDVKFYSKKGAYYGTRRMQVCLSHAYGDTQEVNNRNAIWAVENLLGIAGEKDGAQIDWYLSMDITGIDRLNDLLGGVTVPINDDFSYYDPTMIQGTTMTLNGAQAQIYCRQRYYIGMQSNEARMERQHIYMKAATEKLAALLRDDSDYAMTLLNGMGLIFDNTQAADDEFDFTSVFGGGTPVTDTPTHYLMTNRSLQSIVSTLMRAMEYEVCDVELLPGEHRIGTSGHMEYIMEEDAGLKWALDTLYTPLN